MVDGEFTIESLDWLNSTTEPEFFSNARFRSRRIFAALFEGYSGKTGLNRHGVRSTNCAWHLEQCRIEYQDHKATHVRKVGLVGPLTVRLSYRRFIYCESQLHAVPAAAQFIIGRTDKKNRCSNRERTLSLLFQATTSVLPRDITF